jgi:glycosyltransferase involved in cell wall biosynthesis
MYNYPFFIFSTRRNSMPIKVLYAHGIQEIGGAETDLLAILQGLDRERIHPYVACPPQGAFIERLRSISVPAFPVSFPSWRKVKDVWRIPLAVRSLTALLKREQFDLVHVNDYWWTPVVWLACWICRIPCLVHIRQQIEPRRVKQYWLKHPHRLLAICQEIRRVAIAGGVKPDRVQVVYSGLDLSAKKAQVPRGVIRQRHGVPAGHLLIGTVANLFPRKGYEYLLGALSDVRARVPHIHCVIVGEGDAGYQHTLLNLVKEKNLDAVVTFAGFQSDVLEYMADFDVVVLPSILEGFGIVLLEGMAMGKPVVASRVGGIPEAVEDGVTGILVPPANSSKLADALVHLLEQPALRHSMGEAGRKRVETLFTLKNTVQELEGIYRAVLAEAKS